MKKILLTLLLFFLCIIKVNAADEVFVFDWKNTPITTSDPYDAEYSENLGFNNTYVTVKVLSTEYEYVFNTDIKIYDKDGKVVKEALLERTHMYSVITHGDYIYMVVQELIGSSNFQKLLKIDTKLDIVEELDFLTDYTPGVDGMVNARRYGHDILAVDNNELYVFCGEEYMLKTDLDLTKWTNFEYTDTNFVKYFPDLAKEYELMYIWEQKLSENTTPIFDMEVTTHVYEDKIISSGMRWNNDGAEQGVIKVTDLQGNVKTEIVNPDVEKYYQARIISNYIVAISLDYFWQPTQTEVHVYDMSGKLLQKIASEETHYLLLSETKWGFIVTHMENTCNTDNPTNCANYYNEVYYLPLTIDTKVTEGKGTIEAIKDTRNGEQITFVVKPEEGYVLGTLKVYDENGNEVPVSLQGLTFTMPNANVTIEATFVVENVDTADIAIITIIVVSLIGLMMFISQRKKQAWIKE